MQKNPWWTVGNRFSWDIKGKLCFHRTMFPKWKLGVAGAWDSRIVSRWVLKVLAIGLYNRIVALFSPATVGIACHLRRKDYHMSFADTVMELVSQPSEPRTSTQLSKAAESRNRERSICAIALSPFVGLMSEPCAITKSTGQPWCLTGFGGTCLPGVWEAVLQPLNPVPLQWWEAQCWDSLLNSCEEEREDINGMFPRMRKSPFSEAWRVREHM